MVPELPDRIEVIDFTGVHAHHVSDPMNHPRL
jgi:hypothetical protein